MLSFSSVLGLPQWFKQIVTQPVKWHGVHDGAMVEHPKTLATKRVAGKLAAINRQVTDSIDHDPRCHLKGIRRPLYGIASPTHHFFVSDVQCTPRRSVLV